MRKSTLEEHKFKMLQPKALVYDVEPGGDFMKPGNSPPERAFQLLRCGCELLLKIADHGFPTVDKRDRKRGAKWIYQGLLYHGEVGSQLLAIAAPGLLAELDGRLTEDDPPDVSGEVHRRLCEEVEDFYPPKGGNRGFLDGARSEFEVMRTHEPRPSVVNGSQPANPYSQALMRGENPDEDPELVAIQRAYARDYYIDRVIFLAIRQALHPQDQQYFEDKITRFVLVEDESESKAMRERALLGWREGIKPYLEYARLEAQ